MEKKIIRNRKLGEEYISLDHPSGLKILLYPMENYSSCYALFGTRLGSIDTEFKTGEESEFTVVPEGVAHFLEHKLFENEDGGDAFTLFAKTGASANAYTSFERTCYLFSTTGHFEESLGNLLEFVQSPYFTQKTVEKEQGIIGQEINMYLDNPGWRVFFNLLGGLYHNHPVRIDIAGTVESIAKIDADLLYRCYHTFYNLNSMVLAIAGNFDVDSAVSVIESKLKEGKRVTVEQKTPEEPETICKDRVSQLLSVSIPLFHIGFKEQPREGHDLLKAQIQSELLMDLLAGEGSALYRKLYDAGLINQQFGTEVFSGRGYYAHIFSGESKDPEQVLRYLIEEIETLRANGIKKADFARVKKAFHGKTVRGFNDVENVANTLVSSYFAGTSIYDSISVLEEMTCRDVQAMLQNSLDPGKVVLSVINPSE